MSRNTRVQLSINTIIWNDVLAESQAMGFSLSEIVDRALLAQGYGKTVASAALKPKTQEKPVDPTKPPKRWDDETLEEFSDRRAVEQGIDTHKQSVETILKRYQAHGLPEIIYDEVSALERARQRGII